MTAEQESITLNGSLFDSWADNLSGPVALHIRQTMLSVEGKDGVIFPPTYAMSDTRKFGPYAIDELSDGTKVAQIDSVGSQANRMEPMFKKGANGAENLLAKLVPQIEIEVESGEKISLLDVGHRLGDAFVRASELREEVKKAFADWKNLGDATAIAKLAPTSLVFGAWDSRGEQGKLPRIVQSVIRANDVEPLRRSAQYNPPVDYAALEVFSDEDKQKAEGNTKSPLARRGFVHVPAVDTHGGIFVRGGLYREVTVNLVALRQLDGKENGTALRRYVLGLALIAATEAQDGFLRQGCLLTPDPGVPAHWELIHRTGERQKAEIPKGTVLEYGQSAASAFGVGRDRTAKFSREFAREDLPDKKAAAKLESPEGAKSEEPDGVAPQQKSTRRRSKG
jgi:CRISPR-associated protein Csb1